MIRHQRDSGGLRRLQAPARLGGGSAYPGGSGFTLSRHHTELVQSLRCGLVADSFPPRMPGGRSGRWNYPTAARCRRRARAPRSTRHSVRRFAFAARRRPFDQRPFTGKAKRTHRAIRKTHAMTAPQQAHADTRAPRIEASGLSLAETALRAHIGPGCSAFFAVEQCRIRGNFKPLSTCSASRRNRKKTA